jgi:hypothetical protein
MFATRCTFSPYIFAFHLVKISLLNVKPSSFVNIYRLEHNRRENLEPYTSFYDLDTSIFPSLRSI